jgi:hypothetical protein
MRIPVIRGVIDRRILVNFRVAPQVMARQLPAPFRPALVKGYAIAGICLIRLRNIRPRRWPLPWGIGSENAAHRIAVEWEVNGRPHRGVYIPRRDTDSRLNALAGGTLFPGIHHRAQFCVDEHGDHLSVTLRSNDGSTHVHVAGTVATDLPASSVFPSVDDASTFFEQGSLGFSPARREGRCHGLELRCSNWLVEPLAIHAAESSYFADTSRFPAGSVEFDCALVMRGIRHEWHGREDMNCHVASPPHTAGDEEGAADRT